MDYLWLKLNKSVEKYYTHLSVVWALILCYNFVSYGLDPTAIDNESHNETPGWDSQVSIVKHVSIALSLVQNRPLTLGPYL